MAFSVGSATVDIVPDARGFQAKLDAAIRDVEVKVQAVLDAQGIKQQLDDLARDLTVNVKVVLESAGVREELDAIGRDVTANVKVDLDDAEARAKLDLLTRPRDATVNVKADTGGADSKLAAIGSAAGGGIGGINGLVAAAALLGPAIIPVAGAAAGALAAIGPAAVAGGAGIGVLALGFSKIVGAVQAVSKAHAQAGTAAAASAAAQVDSAKRIEAAQAALKSAEASLANTRANAADSARRAAEAVLDAQRGIKAAQQQAAQGVEQAIAREVAAERNLQGALLSETQAQRALSAARVQAKRDIEDLNNSLADGQLAQRQAALDVQTTYAALVASKDSGSPIERQQAQLNYDTATQRQKELGQNQERLAAKKTESDKQGVEGSPEVVAAKQQLAEAKQGVADARAAVVQAQKAITDARVKGAAEIAKAERALTDAQAAQTTQARQSAFAIAQAQQAVANAQRNLRDAYAESEKASKKSNAAADAAKAALAALTPEGRRLVDYIESKVIPGFDKLRKIAEAPIASGALKGLKAAEPIVKPLQKLVKALAGGLGDLLESAGKALGSKTWTDFIDLLSKIAGPLIKGFGEFVGNILDGLIGIGTKFAPIGTQIGKWLVDLSEKFKNFGTGKSGGLQKFFDYVEKYGPLVASTIGSIVTAVGHILDALSPLGGQALTYIKKFADYIAKLPKKTIQDVAKAIQAVIIGMTLFSGAQKVLGGLGSAFKLLSSPVGLVVAAVALLVIGAILLYKHFKPFHDFVDKKLMPVLKAVARDAMAGIHKGIDTVRAAIKRNEPTLKKMFDDFKRVGTFITEKILPLLGPILKKAFEKLGDFIGTAIGTVANLYNAFRDAVIYIGQHMSDMYTSIHDTWTKKIKPVFQAISDFVTVTIPKAFGDGVDAIGTAWDALKDAAKKPINFVVTTVLNDGLIKAFNAVSGVVSGPHIDDIPWPPKGWSRGGWTGPGGKFDPAGIVHADEFVINKESRQRIEREAPGYLDQLNGYATGGLVQPTADGGSRLRKFRPVKGRISQGLHDTDTAFPGIDFGVPVGTPVAAAATGRVTRSEDLRGYEPRLSLLRQNGFKSYGKVIQILSQGFETLYAHLSKRGVKVGDNVAGGQIIGLSGNTGHSFGPHLHFGSRPISPTAFLGGSEDYTGTVGDGGSSVVSSIIDYVANLKNKFTAPLSRLSELGSSPFAQIVGGIPRKLATALTEKAKSFADPVGNVVGAVGKGAGVARWTPTVIQALLRTGLPLSLTDNWLRQISSESSGNPNAIQGNIGDVNNRSGDLGKGLVQVIGATFRGYRDKSLPNNVFNPLANLVAGMNWAKHRYGASHLEAVIGHGHGYDQGGWLQPGTTLVHNNTGKPEPVFNPVQWKTLERLATGGRGGGPMVHVEKIETADARGVAAEIENRWALREALYPAW